MYIKKVSIENFKIFNNKFEVQFNNGVNIIAGNNEAGKSTIVEAVHLALSGHINGKSIKLGLSQYLFNVQSVNEYLGKVKINKSLRPPTISIEVYFDDSADPELMGDNNTEDASRCGIIFRALFDENYSSEYEEYASNNEMQTLPIEYYKYEWESFARQVITPRSIKLKSVLIDSSSSSSGSYDNRIVGVLKNCLDESETVRLSQDFRRVKERFNSESSVRFINEKISTISGISNKPISVSVDLSSKNAWDGGLLVEIDKIPLQHAGRGEQCAIKAKIAMHQKRAKNSNIVLIEEPENHLSHSNLSILLEEMCSLCYEKQVIITTHNSFVANKLGLDKLILINGIKCIKLSDLHQETYDFFMKLAGYDTLRFLLCKKSILVEGDSDELIVQRAYIDSHKKLPIQDGIDVISVGTAFLRFLELSTKINKPVSVVTDNDGDIEALRKKYKAYEEILDVKICYDTSVETGDLNIGDKNFNYNTLEPKLLKSNDLELMNRVLNTSIYDVDEMHRYMKANKTNVALKIFQSDVKIQYPHYIIDSFS